MAIIYQTHLIRFESLISSDNFFNILINLVDKNLMVDNCIFVNL